MLASMTTSKFNMAAGVTDRYVGERKNQLRHGECMCSHFLYL